MKPNHYAQGIEIAKDLQWRFLKTTEASPEQTTDDMIMAVAWALQHFDTSERHMDGILDQLGLKWVEKPMGGWRLDRIVFGTIWQSMTLAEAEKAKSDYMSRGAASVKLNTVVEGQVEVLVRLDKARARKIPEYAPEPEEWLE